MKYKYELRNSQGQVCCAGNHPDFARCGKCGPTPRTAAAPPAPAVIRASSEAWRNHFADRLGAESETPDPYAAAKEAAPYAPVPSDDPRYDPYGTPPNPYDLALLNKQIEKETTR